MRTELPDLCSNVDMLRERAFNAAVETRSAVCPAGWA